MEIQDIFTWISTYYEGEMMKDTLYDAYRNFVRQKLGHT